MYFDLSAEFIPSQHKKEEAVSKVVIAIPLKQRSNLKNHY